ncbi:hypothetical protein PENSPDRAFT_737055 [Peniophora sp. CONT]|nr:hypothetical protein PENSPDRAFT_737055 [Peniophora sp. CONT]
MAGDKRARANSVAVKESEAKKQKKAPARATPNANWGTKAKPNDAAHRAQGAFESEKYRKSLFGPKKGEATNKTGIEQTFNNIAVDVVFKDQVPEGQVTAYGHKIKGLFHAYRKEYNKLAQEIKQTGGGIRDAQLATLVEIEEDDDEESSTRVMECYVPADGPTSETPQKYKNIWEELTAKFAFFPRWHALLASRPSSNPPSVTTGLSPERNGGHITTFYQPPPDNLQAQHNPIPDELIDPELRAIPGRRPEPEQPPLDDSDEEMPPTISQLSAQKAAPRTPAPSRKNPVLPTPRPVQSTPRPSSTKKSLSKSKADSQKTPAKPNPAQQSIEANKSKFKPIQRESIHSTIRSVVETSAKEARAARLDARLTTEINRLREDIRYAEERRDKRLAAARDEQKDGLVTKDEYLAEKKKINEAVDSEVARLRKDMERAQREFDRGHEDDSRSGSRTPSRTPNTRTRRERSPSWGTIGDGEDEDIEDITERMKAAQSSSPAAFDEDDDE